MSVVLKRWNSLTSFHKPYTINVARIRRMLEDFCKYTWRPLAERNFPCYVHFSNEKYRQLIYIAYSKLDLFY